MLAYTLKDDFPLDDEESEDPICKQESAVEKPHKYELMAQAIQDYEVECSHVKPSADEHDSSFNSEDLDRADAARESQRVRKQICC